MKHKNTIIYLIIASLLWSMGGLFIKVIDWNPLAIAGTRSGIAALVMVIYIGKFPDLRKLNLRTLAGAVSYAVLLVTFVTATKLTTSANAVLLQYTSPIWVVLLSRVFLKIKIRKFDMVIIVAVLAGMVLFFMDELSLGSNLGNGIALISGIFMAIFVILLQNQKDTPAIYVTLLGNVIAFLALIPFYSMPLPNTRGIACLLLLGVLQLGISYLFYTRAVTHVSSLEATLVPILEPLLNPVWVLIFTGEKPGVYSLIGGILVVIAVITHQLYHIRQRKTP